MALNSSIPLVTFGPWTAEGGLKSGQPAGQNSRVGQQQTGADVPSDRSNGPHGPEAAACWPAPGMSETTCWTARDSSCLEWLEQGGTRQQIGPKSFGRDEGPPSDSATIF